MSEGKERQAIPIFTRMLEADPQRFDALVGLGDSLHRLHDCPEAIAYYRRAACWAQPAMPRSRSLRMSLMDCLMSTGQLPQAQAVAQELVRLDPPNAAAGQMLGVLLAEQGKIAAAQAQFANVVRLTPGDPAAHYNLAVALTQLGQLPVAAREYAAALALEPANPARHRDLGAALRKLGQLDEADRQDHAAAELEAAHAHLSAVTP